MKIKIYSIESADALIQGGKWISIRDFGNDYLYKRIDQKAENLLTLTFDDVDPYRVHRNILHPFYTRAFKEREPIFFDEDMAKQIYDFVNESDEDLHIHCFAGISRSQAVGAVVNIFMNGMAGDKNEFINNITERNMVNPHVFMVMMNVFSKARSWK